MSYIRRTNSRLGHFERQRFGGMGSPGSMYISTLGDFGSCNNPSIARLPNCGQFPSVARGDWRASAAATSYSDALLAAHAKDKSRYNEGISKGDGYKRQLSGPIVGWLDTARSRVVQVGTQALSRSSADAARFAQGQQAAADQFVRYVDPVAVQKATVEKEQAAEPGFFEQAGDIVAAPLVWAFGWGTGPDASGKYKEEEIERERIKAEEKAQAKRDTAREGPSITDRLVNWWEGDETSTPTPAVIQPSRPAPTPSRPAPTPSRPAPTPSRPAPTPSRPTYKPAPKPGFWDTFASGFTDIFKETAPIAANIYGSKLQADQQTAMMRAMMQPRQRSQPQTIIIPKKSNTGLYIGLGVGAAALMILGAVVVMKGKGPTSVYTNQI